MRSHLRYFLIIIILFIGLKFYYDVIDHAHDNDPKISGSEVSNFVDRSLERYWADDEHSMLIPEKKLDDMSSNDSGLIEDQSELKSDISRTSQKLDGLLDFNVCQMSTCFNYSKCDPKGPIKVHILPASGPQFNESLNTTGESNIIHNNILKIIRQSVHFEEDPTKACLFVLGTDSLDRDPLSRSFRSALPDLLTPEYNYGMNHVVFNLYSGSWPDYRENDFAGFNIGAALLAKASNSITYHRQNFDVSLPLFSYLHPTFQEEIPLEKRTQNENRNRSFFLTFKGKRYVVGGGSDTRNSLYHLNNHNDVIMLTTCRHGKKWREANDARCSKDDASYDQYDFDKLMRDSLFCLTPRGRRLGSFRFLEALSYDCIPIILGDGWVWPFGEIVDWSQAAMQFAEEYVFHVPDMLRDVDQQTIRAMQQNCRNFYQQYFSTTEKIILTTLSIIERRVKNHYDNLTT